MPLSARDLEKQMEKEMEKWKKDRPSSTFDPRRRCTGYQMVWAVAQHNQQMLEKMERERGHLSVPLTRSVSTLSLSPKRWRKGGKVGAEEREGGVRVVRHLSMGARDEVNFKDSQRAHQGKGVASQELTGQSKTKKQNFPNMAAEHSDERFKDQTEQEEPKSKGMDKSLIRETVENKKQTEETKLIDQTGNHQQPTEQTEMQSDSQSHNLEDKSSKLNDQDSQEHFDANTEQDIEESVQQSLGDTENLETAPGKRPHSDTVTKEAEKSSQRDAAKEKHHSTDPLTVSHTQSAADADGLVQTQEKQEENTTTQEDLEHSVQHLHSEAEVGEMLVSDDTVSESSETSVLCLKASDAIQEHDERLLTANPGVEKDESTTQSLITERTSDCKASPQDTEFTLPDGTMSSAQMSPPKEPAPELPKVLGNAGEEKNTESLEESAVENDVFDSIKLTDSNNDLQGGEVRTSSPTQASSRRSSRSSADFCIRKSSSSHGSRLGRRLSEDLFTVPQNPSQPQTRESNSGVQHAESMSNLGAVNSAQSPPDVFSVRASEPNRTDQQQEVPGPPKGLGLFRKLRGQTPKTPKGAPKMQVPKILIQDFSDGTGREKPVQEYKEKLNSRERRRRQREQDRRTKEEQKLRKKREKEQEKVTEREKRKAQILGKDVDLQDEKERCDELHPVKFQSHRQKSSTSYAEFYF